MSISVFTLSCRKDFYQDESDGVIDKSTIKDFRSYFYKVVRKDQNSLNFKGSSISSEKENTKIYPNWDKAILAETDKYELLEVPIFHGNERFVLYNFDKKGKSKTIDESVVNSVFKRLVMYKNKSGIIKERILTYIPDKTYLENNCPDISHNRITKLDKNFSGYIEYADINKNKLFVLQFKEGEAIYKRKLSKKKTVNKSSNATVSSYCGEECFEELEWQCVGTADDPEAYGCTKPVVVDEWCVDIPCDDTEEPEDPCLDPMNMNTGMCGDDDDDDGGGVNPPINPNINLNHILGNHNLNVQQLLKLSNELNNLLSYCAQAYIFNSLKGGNSINFEINNLTSCAGYNPSTNTISFKNDSNINSQNLREELFHAYQNNIAYPGGTAQYTTTGRANIEFEYEVVKDVYTAVTGLGSWSVNDLGYQNWVYSLLGANYAFPKSYNLNFNSGFFKGYLNFWFQENQLDYPNATISNQISPIALNNLLNNNPC